MKEDTIDIEKDFLVVHTNMEGKFSYFQWYPAEKVMQDKIDAQIITWNEQQKLKGKEGRPAKLITDPLIRGICAYKRHAHPVVEMMEEAKEIQGHIDEAIEYLESALADLNRIRGLD